MASANEASQQANRSGMDPLRLVVIFLMLSGVVLSLFLAHVFGLLWARFAWSNPVVVPGPDWSLSTAAGLLVGLGLAVFAYANKAWRARLLESASELMKVTWPTWGETRVSTGAVVVASLIAAFILFGIDTLAYQIMVEWLPNLVGRLGS